MERQAKKGIFYSGKIKCSYVLFYLKQENDFIDWYPRIYHGRKNFVEEISKKYEQDYVPIVDIIFGPNAESDYVIV